MEYCVCISEQSDTHQTDSRETQYIVTVTSDTIILENNSPIL